MSLSFDLSSDVDSSGIMHPRNSRNQDDDHIDDQWDAVVAAAASLGGYFDTTRLTDDSK